MSDLLPCPFCGAPVKITERAADCTTTKRLYFIVCMCDSYSMRAHQWGETAEQVTERWNRRALTSRVAALERDAERYRWMRESIETFPEGFSDVFLRLRGERIWKDFQLDAAIDSALALRATEQQHRGKP